MASICDDVDINQPGFFHLCYFDKDDQTDETRRQYEYVIKRHQLMIKTLKKLNVPLAQVPALENTIAVYLFQIQGREMDAKSHLEAVMDQSDTVGSNTFANLIHIYQNLENGSEIYATEIAELQRKLKLCISATDFQLEAARAMCERGYFYEMQLKENRHQQTLVQFEKALEFFEVGIKNGGVLGMTQVELYVWKFALVRTQINMFDFASFQSIDTETKQNFFEAFADSFEKFYSGAPEECVFYRTRLLMECLEQMTVLKDALDMLPEFDAIIQRGILGDIWDDKIATMEEALAMSPNDFKIPLSVGNVYSRMGKHDEAEKYLEMSKSLESENNILAMSASLITFTHKAKVLEMEHHDTEAAKECLLKAYEMGKKLDSKVMPISTKLEMANVCYHLAIDKTTQPWSLTKHNSKYMKDAIHYNLLALDTHFEYTHQRAHKQLGTCFWIINQHDEAIEHLRKSLNVKESPIYMIQKLKLLLEHASRYLVMPQIGDDKKHELMCNLAQDLQYVWDNITQHDDIKFMCVRFAKHQCQKNRNMITILQEISNQNSENRELLDWFCIIIKENNLPVWLKTYCLNMQADY